MRSDFPWGDIKGPRESSSLSARRIPKVGSAGWGLYWAVDTHRHCLLVLQHDSGGRPSHRLPALRGLQVETQPADDGVRKLVIVRLTDGEHRDIFYRLCLDIIDSTRLAESAEEAVDRLVVRTWRWHRLLRGGRDGRLSNEEQKGLIGELLVLEKHLLPVMGAAGAVRSWVGPLGAPKDFRIGLVGVEAKARTPLAPTLSISSAEQLDSTDEARLFLHLTEVAEALEDSASAVTLVDVVGETRDKIAEQDLSALGDFEERLLATGFDWADDYSNPRWLIGKESLFEVVEGFPRITPRIVPVGVEDVRYMVVLSQCEDYRANGSDLVAAISGENDGN